MFCLIYFIYTFTNMFSFTDKNTFCISLFHHTERWNKMLKRFEYFDLSVCRWPAAMYPDDIIDTFHDDLQKGQRGCAQSHILIWRHMVEHKLEYALILEDDACFDIHWKDKLNRFHLDSTQKNWHAIFLNASEPLHEIDKWAPALNQFLTGGYILSYTGATILLNTFQGCYHTSDWMTSRLQLLGNCYTYFPWLIIQEGADSTIGSGVDADHAKVIRCLGNIQYSLENFI